MLQFEAQLRHHVGPIILVGDFNTWEPGRVRILEALVRRIGLMHIRFPGGIKRVGRHELDRVYVRGGDVARQRVIVDPAASDHGLLAFLYIIR
jgi:endonuclease/exonuclease/phosphatase (EEP) superfamily protein YafD